MQNFCESVLEILLSKHGTRIAKERIKGMFPFAEQEPDEAKEVINPGRLVEFLGLPYSSFREIAPTLPRHAITLARFGYLRRELLA